MNKKKNINIYQMIKSKAGATLLEFGMVIGLISIVSIGAVISNGNKVAEIFCTASTEIENALYEEGGFCSWAMGSTGDAPLEDVVGQPVIGQSAPGVLDVNFVDVVFPEGEVAPQYVMLRFYEGVASETIFRVTSAFETEACYQSEIGNEPICQSYDSGASEIVIPLGSEAVGYKVVLPVDRMVEYQNDLSIDLTSPTYSNAWDVTATRPTYVPEFTVGMSFDDVEFPMYTTGSQQIMVPLEGSYESSLTFGLNNFGPRSYSLCSQELSGEEILCGPVSQMPEDITVASDVYAIGYTVVLPVVAGSEFDEDIEITLSDTVLPSLRESWNVNLTRPQAPEPFVTSLDFEDQSWPMGTVELSDSYVRVALNGGFDENLRLGVTPVNYDARACYWIEEEGAATCGSFSDSITFVTVPTNAQYIGYQLDLRDRDIDVDSDLAIRLGYASTPSEIQTWDPHMSRPLFDPGNIEEDVSLDFPDSISKPMRYSEGEYVLSEVTGTFADYLLLVTNGNDRIDVRPCWENLDNEITCGDYEEDIESIHIPNPANIKRIGFQVGWGSNRNTGVEGPVTVSTYYYRYPEAGTLTYDVDLSRPAYVPSDINSEVSMNFPESISQPMSHSETQIVWSEVTGDFAEHLILRTTGTSGASIRPCVENTSGVVSCGDYDTGLEQFHYPNASDVSRIGIEINWGLAPAQQVNGNVNLDVQYYYYPEAGSLSYDIALDRPAFQPNDIDESISLTYPESVSRPMSYSTNEYIWSAVTGDFENRILMTTTGTAGASVRPCWQHINDTITCGDYEYGTEQFHVTNYANIKNIGIQINWSASPNSAVDGPVTLGIRYYNYASAGNLSYSIDIDRPQYEPEAFTSVNGTVFTDHTYPAGMTDFSDPRAYVIVPLETLEGKSFSGGQLRLVTDGQGLQMQPCWVVNEGDDPVCNWGWSTGPKFSYINPSNIYGVGYRVNVGQTATIDRNVQIQLYYNSYPSSKSIYNIRVVRN